MELIKDTRDLTNNRRSYSTWLLLHFANSDKIKEFHKTTKEGEPVELSITLNGVEVTRADMDKAMEGITESHLKQLGATESKLKQDRENLDTLIEKKAKELLEEKMEGLDDLLYNMKQNIENIDFLAKGNISWMQEEK